MMTKRQLLLMALTIMCSLVTIAENVAYCVSVDGVLTFYYDDTPNEKGAAAHVVYLDRPTWSPYSTDLDTCVVFDSSFAAVRPKTCAGWFANSTNLTSFKGLENLNTSEVESMALMFGGCSSLTELDLSSFDTHNVKDMSGMFSGCTSLKSIRMDGFDTHNVTDMSSMFNDCYALEDLDVSSFETSNVTDMGAMFGWCWKLTNLDVGKFDTSNVTTMSSLFYCCYNLESLDVSSFDTSNVTDMQGMFYGCYSLKSLDLSTFDTSNVKSMQSMFSYCWGLTGLNLKNFDTSNLQNTCYMFHSCYGLTSIDLSSFDASNLLWTTEMFNNCNSLTTIYVGDGWKTYNCNKYGAVSSDMFLDCQKLVGSAGTVYDELRIDGTYAHVDGGPSSPGYFTFREKNASPTRVDAVEHQLKKDVTIFNIQGQRMTKPKSKGLYIVNGRKVITF